jgi:hypothetical protein
MKKSKIVTLVLITASLASCSKPQQQDKKKVHMRSDTTASYTRTHNHGLGMWYYAFRPYGSYYNGSYQRSGFYSSGLSERSNIGSNSTKSGIVRGGFGSRGISVSS